MPAGVRSGSDTVIYIYDSNNRLQQIQQWYRFNDIFRHRYVVTYSSDKIDKVYVSSQPTPPFDTESRYEFFYGANLKPERLDYYPTGFQTPIKTFFHYDAENRLVRKEAINYTARYEYTSDNNVKKIFYTIPNLTQGEILGEERSSYDAYPRFFAGSPELTQLEIYLFNYEPSVNNVLSLTLSAKENAIYTPAQPFSFTLTYDGKSVSSIRASNVPGVSPPLFTFNDMEYSCR